ncbi:glycosyltransferase [Streptomyces sp. TRM68367]|uniref:glycosyltransferase n=1 Tax=Streptomyces sp. TRM68367 TaxID=2758415 RepID=UPI00165C95FC|nr:glycosyltransferase [Streptomyces sp. TRM68367]MBC9726111.1 glycosyltransferase [Streptomyces sp. TRM68367]
MTAQAQKAQKARRARHKQARDPRGHWLLLALLLPVLFGLLLFQGWTEHEVDAAKDRAPCTSPVPDAVARGGPVIGINGNGIQTASMPARTLALTFDGGPEPVWTPRLLDLLDRYRARATFFVNGARAAEHPDLIKRIRAEGHEIGSNTYTGAVLGQSSAARFSAELGLTQTALAGATGLHTNLLRMPRTTTPETLCGRDWQAARRATDRGYVLVAADTGTRKPAQGTVRQLSHTQTAYDEAERLLKNRTVDRFTTVSQAADLVPYDSASSADRWQGQGFLWATAAGRAFSDALTWTLVIAGGLGVLRLLLLALFARAHVRRLARFRPGAPWMQEVTGPVTVLVPAYNEEAGIEATVRSLLDSTHQQLQIVVIDDGSTDRTADIAAGIGDPRVEVVRKANGGKAAALNAGLAHARYDIVVMVDANTVFERDAIQRIIQPLAHPAVGAVSGNTKVGNRRHPPARPMGAMTSSPLTNGSFEPMALMPGVPRICPLRKFCSPLSTASVSLLPPSPSFTMGAAFNGPNSTNDLLRLVTPRYPSPSSSARAAALAPLASSALPVSPFTPGRMPSASKPISVQPTSAPAALATAWLSRAAPLVIIAPAAKIAPSGSKGAVMMASIPRTPLARLRTSPIVLMRSLACGRPKLQMGNGACAGDREFGRVLRGLCAADTVRWLDTHSSHGYSATSGARSRADTQRVKCPNS